MSQPPSPPDPVRQPAGDETPSLLPAAAGDDDDDDDAAPHSLFDEASPRAPRSKTEMVRVFTRLALQGFGGVLPIAQRELVERERWLTREQFVEMLSVAQVLPGPNVVNLALMFGDRAFGWRGAVAALFGMLAAPLVVVLALTLVYARFASHPAVAGALQGMSMVAAGLIFATGVKLLTALRGSPLGRPVACVLVALTVVGIAVLRAPLAAVLLVLGAASCVQAWRRLAR
jgi:chromate transporter